ncbi:MAG: Asp23/Gls24 family envelope stress response protein [Ruminococcus sp.]|nr:Asp23/Gls24 family envelope stress response protein [Ruminococcus sp.]
MIKTSNHLGTITISKRYLVKQVTILTESCFGVAGLKGVEITQQGNAVSVRLNVITTGEVNLPAVADAVSHKVAYVLVNRLGVSVKKIEIFTDDIVD